MKNRIDLVNYTPEFEGKLFEFRNSIEFREYVAPQNSHIDFTSFQDEIQQNLQFRKLNHCVLHRRNQHIIGYTYSFSHNVENKFCFLNLFIEKKYNRAGFGLEAFYKSAKILFSQYDLYKIYIDVFSFNELSLQCMRSAGFTEEGILRGHVLRGNVRYDIHRFACYREFPERIARLMG